MNAPAPILVVTPGEPAGIGPECLLRACIQRPDLALLAVADPRLLTDTARRLSLDVRIEPWSPGQPVRTGTLACHAGSDSPSPC
jgi:4-hydroxythreonine-4-phosphate dehydrogenase